MARSRKCKCCPEWHDVEEWPAACAGHYKSYHKANPGLATPLINSDTIDLIQSQTDGKYYDSKSALRSEYKRAGVVEVGNDKVKPKEFDRMAHRKSVRDSIEKAAAQVRLTS